MASEPDEPRTITPFKIIERGDDTLGANGEVLFADFSPRIVPADTPDDDEEEVVVVPKGESAPEPVASPESTSATEQTTSETNVPTPADKADGSPNPNEPSLPTSSSDQKPGPSEPPA